MLLEPKGYFHANSAGGPGMHTMLIRHGGDEPVTVMSTLPMEIESNAKHVAAASGTVVVMGAGLGLTLYNIAMKPDVERVIVVERDPDVIELLREATNLESWQGFEKLNFVVADALSYEPQVEIDFLYADIWDELGASESLAETQAMQSHVGAKRVGWWGQEFHFLRWLLEQGPGLTPTLELYERWSDAIRLPLQCDGDASYVELIETVMLNYPHKVGLESSRQSTPIAVEAPPTFNAEGLVDSALAPDGTRLTLCRRNDQYGIQADGRELMATEARTSEEALASLSCKRLADLPGVKVVIGGLGMGFTLRAALDALPDDACVSVIEVVGAVVDWNRRYLHDFNGDALSDSRVTVVVSDVVNWLQESRETFDAILLDVDNGPEQLALASNAALYSVEGLELLNTRLKPRGVLAFWSAGIVRRFEARLAESGFEIETHMIDSEAAGRPGHVVYVATRCPQ